jgi:pimeloyl-ACP methyl ester carboxylesterase
MSALDAPATHDVVTVTTARGISGKVRRYGDPGRAPVVYLHGTTGLLPSEPVLEGLARSGRCVLAPEWPGFGEEATEDALDDMLGFTLHGWDLVEALGLGGEPIDVVGHSMGGMIAAEMACLAPRQVRRLVLVAATGLWLDARPVPDIFGVTALELPALLFAEPETGVQALTGGLDFSNDAALTAFMVQNARRPGTAGKLLFPIPNRGLAKRLYRCTVPTLLVWGEDDGLVPPVYADRFAELLPGPVTQVRIPGAGHLPGVERPDATLDAVRTFLA